MRSSRAFPPRRKPLMQTERRRVDRGDAGNDAVGERERSGAWRKARVRHGNDEGPGSVRGAQTVARVFDRATVAGLDPEQLSRPQIHVRLGFAAINFF